MKYLIALILAVASQLTQASDILVGTGLSLNVVRLEPAYLLGFTTDLSITVNNKVAFNVSPTVMGSYENVPHDTKYQTGKTFLGRQFCKDTTTDAEVSEDNCVDKTKFYSRFGVDTGVTYFTDYGLDVGLGVLISRYDPYPYISFSTESDRSNKHDSAVVKLELSEEYIALNIGISLGGSK